MNQPPAGQPIYVRTPPTSGMAIASLIFGILGTLGGWVLFGLPCLAAIATGHQAFNETSTGAKSGRGMAIVGLILGYLFILPGAVVTFKVVAADWSDMQKLVAFIALGVSGTGALTWYLARRR